MAFQSRDTADRNEQKQVKHLCPLRHGQFKRAGHHLDRVSVGKETSTPPTTTVDDRGAPSYDRTATLDRIAQNPSLWRGSAALKPQLA